MGHEVIFMELKHGKEHSTASGLQPYPRAKAAQGLYESWVISH